jgi:hypothetical protein
MDGVTVSPTALTIPEGGSDRYTAVLNTQPSGTVTVTHEAAGGGYDGVTGAAVSVTVADNDNAAATGQPAVTGIAQVGQTLTASRGTLADTNGMSNARGGSAGYAYTYEWVRVDGMTESTISGATASTYTLQPADEGKRVKVKVSFTDDRDNAEGPVTSGEYPSSGTVAAACPGGDLWCAGMLIGAPGGPTDPEGYCDGFCLNMGGPDIRYGELSNRAFYYDTANSLRHEISSLRYATGDKWRGNWGIDGEAIILWVTPTLAGGWTEDPHDLQLEVGGKTFEFSEADVAHCCGADTEFMRIAWGIGERLWPAPGEGTTVRVRLMRKNDAALSDLSVVDQDGYLVGITPLSAADSQPGGEFAPGTKRYKATVPRSVNSIVVTATPVWADASVEYVRANDRDRTDEDPATPELEASLMVGLNRVRVKVTRGSETATYVVAVTRESGNDDGDGSLSEPEQEPAVDRVLPRGRNAPTSVTVRPVASPVSEGEDALFELERTCKTGAELVVIVTA